LIDLHTHTTASDGRCGPAELVARAVDAGITVLGVADHDTVAAIPEVATAASGRGIRLVPGIEITAVWRGTDVHVLGYFIDCASDRLARFLKAQREERLRRVRVMAGRLAALGCPIDVNQTFGSTWGWHGKSVGRPMVARALVDAGHVGSTSEAFDRLLGEGRPAFEPRRGPSPADVVRGIADAAGFASLAHPGVLGHDELIPELVAAGMPALEVYHADHTPEQTARYLAIAREHSLFVTGGSDYHGDEGHGATLGTVTLPAEEFERFEQAHRVWRAG
jgi:hypothetical protein